MFDVQGIHLISTGQQTNDALRSAILAARPYVHWLHLREKQKTALELYQLIQAIQDDGLTHSRLIVNDRIDVATACGLQTVQLAGHSLPVKAAKQQFPEMNFGCSIHSPDEAKIAATHGASYVMFGHLYDTSSKQGLPGRGIHALADVCRVSPIPVVAIGGIKPEHLGEIRAAGAVGVAILSGILLAEQPELAARRYAESWIEAGERIEKKL